MHNRRQSAKAARGPSRDSVASSPTASHDRDHDAQPDLMRGPVAEPGRHRAPSSQPSLLLSTCSSSRAAPSSCSACTSSPCSSSAPDQTQTKTVHDDSDSRCAFCTTSCGPGRPPKTASSSLPSFKNLSKALTALVVFAAFLRFSEACSSRSTPKPRPPSPTTRPNITFQTYACPEAYAKWYCLNGATCFSVRIGESILYNCECADGYMGQRCEFKDLDGSYLPSREKVLIEKAGVAGGVVVVILLMVVVSMMYLTFVRRRNDSRHFLDQRSSNRNSLRTSEELFFRPSLAAGRRRREDRLGLTPIGDDWHARTDRRHKQHMMSGEDGGGGDAPSECFIICRHGARDGLSARFDSSSSETHLSRQNEEPKTRSSSSSFAPSPSSPVASESTSSTWPSHSPSTSQVQSQWPSSSEMKTKTAEEKKTDPEAARDALYLTEDAARRLSGARILTDAAFGNNFKSHYRPICGSNSHDISIITSNNNYDNNGSDKRGLAVQRPGPP